MSNLKSGIYIDVFGEEVEFNFYTSLRASQKVKFVSSVVDTLVGDEYHSIIKDLVFDFMIIEMFTDVDTSGINDSPNMIDDIENIVYNTNIVDVVKSEVGFGVINELRDAVDLSIEYKTGIHKNKIEESLCFLIDTVERKIDTIDIDSMMNIANAISGVSGELTAEKLIEAYANTDMYKNQWKKLEEEKMKSANVKNADSASGLTLLSPLA